MTRPQRGQASVEQGGNLGVWLVCCLPSGNLSWFAPHNASSRPRRAQPGRQGGPGAAAAHTGQQAGGGAQGHRSAPRFSSSPTSSPGFRAQTSSSGPAGTVGTASSSMSDARHGDVCHGWKENDISPEHHSSHHGQRQEMRGLPYPCLWLGTGFVLSHVLGRVQAPYCPQG